MLPKHALVDGKRQTFSRGGVEARLTEKLVVLRVRKPEKRMSPLEES